MQRTLYGYGWEDAAPPAPPPPPPDVEDARLGCFVSLGNNRTQVRGT